MNVRLITPEDEEAYRTIVALTSDEDRYHRFFRPVKVRDVLDVRRFVEKRSDLVGFIAETSGAEREPLGAAHAALLDDGSAELAIIVADSARGIGVGKALMVALITYLQRRGVHHIVAHSLQENIGFTRLAQSLGMHIERSAGADLLWSVARTPVHVPQRFPAAARLSA